MVIWLRLLKFITFLDTPLILMKRVFFLCLIALTCVSCNPTKDKYPLYNSSQHDHGVDLSKLEDENGCAKESV